MRALNKIILIGIVLAPIIFTSSTFPYISDTFASFTDTKHVDGTIAASVWDTQDDLVGQSDSNLTENSDRIWGTILGTSGNLYIAPFDNNTSEDNVSNNGSSVNNLTKNDSAAGNESFNQTADNLNSDNQTADNLNSDNQTTDNLTADNQTANNQTANNQTADNMTAENQTSTNGGSGGSSGGSFDGSSGGSSGGSGDSGSSGGSGGSSDDTDTEVVIPVANFSSNVTSGYAPLSVQFTDLSANASEWEWIFGDGTGSDERNPAHTYFTAGTYDLSLKVTNSNAESSKFAEITVLEKPAVVIPPVANFSSSTTRSHLPVSIQFKDLSVNATQWKWDFGDGNTSTEQNPAHTYYIAGNYKMTLTVSNPAGSNSFTKTGSIKEGVLSSVRLTSLTLDGENAAGATTNSGVLTTNILDSFGQIGIKDESGAFLNQLYSVGSLGEISIPLWVGINDFTLVADGVFPGNGNYGVVLFFDGVPTSPQIVVYNLNGGTGRFLVQPAGTGITGSANGGLLLDKAPGKSEYIAPDGTKIEILSFVVDSRSGTTDEVSGVNPGSKGTPDTTAKLSLKVTPPVALPVAAFSASPTSGNAPLKVAFTDASTGFPAFWNWNFGDGAASTGQNAVHIYNKAGNYTATLTAGNGNGTNSTSAMITVSAQPVPVLPVANFNSNVTSGYAALPVKFTDLSENATQWNWDFGDGATSPEQNPAHVYYAAGTYTIKLTAINNNGQNTKTGQIFVNKNSDGSDSDNNQNSTNNS